VKNFLISRLFNNLLFWLRIQEIFKIQLIYTLKNAGLLKLIKRTINIPFCGLHRVISMKQGGDSNSWRGKVEFGRMPALSQQWQIVDASTLCQAV